MQFEYWRGFEACMTSWWTVYTLIYNHLISLFKYHWFFFNLSNDRVWPDFYFLPPTVKNSRQRKSPAPLLVLIHFFLHFVYSYKHKGLTSWAPFYSATFKQKKKPWLKLCCCCQIHEGIVGSKIIMTKGGIMNCDEVVDRKGRPPQTTHAIHCFL